MTLRVANLASSAFPATVTDLTVTNNLTLSAGTANGVLYLNGSKVATSGTALAFNGTSLSVTGNVFSSNAGNENYFLSDGSTRSSLQQNGNAFYYNVNDNSATSGLFVWRNTNAVSELMRLTSTGLGIGTSNPTVKLQVTGTISVSTDSLARGQLSWDGANGLYLNNTDNTPLRFGTSNTERMRLDAAGNLGLGVTPSAWEGTYRALSLASFGGASIAGRTSTSAILLTSNAFRASSGNWTYASTGPLPAARYEILDGAHQWFNAASGTAGNTISFTQAMTLDASGNLAIGTTNAGGTRLRVVGASGAASILVSASNSTSQPTFGIQGGFPGFYDDGGLITYGGNVKVWMSPGVTNFLDSNVRIKRFLEGYDAGSNSIDFGTSVTQDFIFQTTGARILHRTNQNNSIVFITNGAQRLEITGGGNIVPGTAALATNATDGFLYVPTCAGTPTGTPTTYTGRSPIVVDTTNNKLYFYSGGQWRDAGP